MTGTALVENNVMTETVLIVLITWTVLVGKYVIMELVYPKVVRNQQFNNTIDFSLANTA